MLTSSLLQETVQLYESSTHTTLPSVVDRLSHILLYDPTSVSIRIRRGIAFYRLRLLSEALNDLTRAIEVSKTSVEGVPDQHEPDVDALRMRALVLEEMQFVSLSFPLVLLRLTPLSFAVRTTQLRKTSTPSSPKNLTTSSPFPCAPSSSAVPETRRAQREFCERSTWRYGRGRRTEAGWETATRIWSFWRGCVFFLSSFFLPRQN